MVSNNNSNDNKSKMSTITTIYIPRMSSAHDEDCVIKEFENKQIGKVSRVDFVPTQKVPGFNECVDGFVRSAFVHFHYYYNNVQSNKIMQKISGGERHKIDVLITTNPYDHMKHVYEYWILLKAINPIQRTMMNTHQIVENCRFLEEKIYKQSEIIEKLEKKLEVTHQAIYHMVNDMVFKSGREYMPDIYKRVLMGETFDTDCHCDCDHTDDEESIVTMSTHGSLPELVDITDNWSRSDKSLEYRIRNSNELCGNE